MPLDRLSGLRQLVEEVVHGAEDLGFVGTEDCWMDPLVRPGSLVLVDPSRRTIEAGPFRNEFERPIYFIELRNEYICSWCEIRDGHLLAVPYPNSRCEIRQFPYPREAEIVGRVTGVAMRLTELDA